MLNVLKNNDVVAVKFFAGEEFVAKIVKLELFRNVVVVSKPLSLVMTPQGAQFVPWIMTGIEDLTIDVDTNHAIVVPANNKVASAYIQVTTGIVSATNNGGGIIKPV